MNLFKRTPKDSAKEDDTIIVPQARDRLLELFEREQLPGEVRSSLSGSLTGNLVAQQLLFQAMIDTWPRLQKALREVKLAARKAPWEVKPFSERGEDPTPNAEKLAKDVERAIWGMKPDPKRGLKGFEGTIEALVEGYFLGHQVSEIHWKRYGSEIRPCSSFTLPPRYYGYPDHQDSEDRLMLDPEGNWSTLNREDFPDHRFLIAVNGGHPGHATVAAPMRALAGYWLAAVYGLKWLLKYSELFGVPYRWAEYADVTDKKNVANMLKNIGNAGWGAFKEGTKLNFVDALKSSNSLPQRDLIKLADEQVDVFILGQTLTSSAGDKGSQALGNVHMGVRKELIEGICDFSGEILTHQLVPAYCFHNYGRECEDAPSIWPVWKEQKDLKTMAERDSILGLMEGKVKVGKQWFYERHEIPVPSDQDELFVEERVTVDDEDDVSSLVTASAAELSTVDRLSSAVLEGLTGVQQEWLAPIRPTFERLMALAMSDTVTDEDFLKALEEAREKMPEQFDELDSEALQEAFENAIGSAMLAGSTRRLEEQ